MCFVQMRLNVTVMKQQNSHFHGCQFHGKTYTSGSTIHMRIIGEARNANLLNRTRLITESVVFWWVGNLYEVYIETCNQADHSVCCVLVGGEPIRSVYRTKEFLYLEFVLHYQLI